MSKNIFKDNPNLSEAFITSNGEVFYQKGDAEIEAKKLSDKKIEHVINPSEKVAVSEPFVQVAENKDGSPKLEYSAEISTDRIKKITVEAAVSYAIKTDREKAKELFEAAFKPVELTVESPLVTQDQISEALQNSSDNLTKDVQEVLQKGVAASETNSDQNVNAPTTEVKLTGKQQAQKDYTDKFGEIPAEDFTTKQLFAAIASGEKLVAELNND